MFTKKLINMKRENKHIISCIVMFCLGTFFVALGSTPVLNLILGFLGLALIFGSGLYALIMMSILLSYK
jgi:hypothetical protein